jgi:hypothetical protein
MFCNYKMALSLYKVFNYKFSSNEWLHLNFNQIEQKTLPDNMQIEDQYKGWSMFQSPCVQNCPSRL